MSPDAESRIPAPDWRPPGRREAWDRLVSEEFDLLVLGGGINGAGVARDAALRGLKVALVEARDFAWGTSSRSSKLVHGGLRYLETYQFRLVRESTAERAVQMRLAPHLVRPMDFFFPVYRQHRHGVLFMDVGLWLYDALALFRVPKLHRAFGAGPASRRLEVLRREGLKGGLTYIDCATDDGRLVLENLQDAASLGAVALNYVEAQELLQDSKGVCGAGVRDLLSGRTAEVRARMVVGTLGPFTDAFLERAGVPVERRILRPTRGSHLVFPAEALPVPEAVVMISPTDRRPVFAIPWHDRVYVGTTDVDHEAAPDQVACTQEEVSYLMEVLSWYFPDLGLRPEQVTGTWAGLRPLVDEPDVEVASRVSREHEILEPIQGLVLLVGGKLTTYRLMAAQTVDFCCRLLEASGAGRTSTHRRVLPGARGWEARREEILKGLQDLGLERGDAEFLGSLYGVAALRLLDLGSSEKMAEGRYELLSQVDLAVEREFAVRIEDVLVRRTSLALRDAERARQAAGKVARRMAELLEWDDERTSEEVRAFEAWLESSLGCVRPGGTRRVGEEP